MKLTKKFRTAIFFLVTLLLINGLFPIYSMDSFFIRRIIMQLSKNCMSEV